jgi:hypothetical protein
MGNETTALQWWTSVDVPGWNVRKDGKAAGLEFHRQNMVFLVISTELDF